jgi:UDP-N-acetylmuramoyl-L-alanyl-D-glutamate--2,6-diaminopimelate ligase
MKLTALLNGLKYSWKGDFQDHTVQHIEFDSRKVQAAGVFVALEGVATDGHLYIDKAIEKGARIIVCQYVADLQDNILYIQVKDTSTALARIASNFYDNPSSKLKLVGITGTNGKTTTASLLYQLFTQLGYAVGLISTVVYKIAARDIPATHTTPDILQLNQLLARMNDAGCEYAFMEVSSHAIVQQRVVGLQFAGGLFTNISHDHLDYHQTFQNYIEAKKGFFDLLPKEAFALTNIDDKRGQVMLQNTAAKKVTYALKNMADFKAKIIENNLSGLLLDLDGASFFARLVGGFNAYNLLAVYATASLLKANKLEVLAIMSNLESPEGRFDYFIGKQQGVAAIVDYAHTPDALEKVLQTIDKLRSGNEQIITVVGCGGDRDKTKRPLMAKVACNYSQQIILTSDNPRSEVPASILQDMQVGVPPYAVQKTLIIEDRKQAIRTACRLAQKGDIVLVAGKGHEKYQEIMGKKYPFDDKEELKNELNERR